MATTFHTTHRTAHQVAADQSLAFVSATSLGVDAEVRGMQRPAVPNYALRRLLVGTAAALLALVVLVGGWV